MVKYLKIGILWLTIIFLFTCANAQESGIRRRQVSNSPAAEATVTINQQFASSFLDAIFTNLKEPSVSLNRAGAQYGCSNTATLKRELGGVRTTVRFESGHIAAPLAFSGSYYSSLLGCIQFEGSANATINLEYDRGRQELLGRLRVDDIRLTNVPTLASGPLLSLVQSAIDARYNPFTVLTLDQLSARAPIAPAGGALRLRAKEIRPEITPGSLQLHVMYDFVRAQ